MFAKDSSFLRLPHAPKNTQRNRIVEYVLNRFMAIQKCVSTKYCKFMFFYSDKMSLYHEIVIKPILKIKNT